jgi:hypothetical protein
LALDIGLRRCIKSKHKKPQTLKERKELIAIIEGALWKNMPKPMNKKGDRMKVKGF